MRLTLVSEISTLEMPAPQWTKTEPFLRSLIKKKITLFDGSVGKLKIHGNVLLFGVHEREDNVGEIRGNFEMFKTWSGSDDSFDVELLDDFEVRGCVQIAEKKAAGGLSGGNDNVMGTVRLLGIVIEEHGKGNWKLFLYINCHRGYKISELKATEQIIVLLNGKKKEEKSQGERKKEIRGKKE